MPPVYSAHIDEAKHPRHRGVPRGRYAAVFCGVERNAEAAGVGERDFLMALADNDAAAPMIIRIDKAVGQRFA